MKVNGNGQGGKKPKKIKGPLTTKQLIIRAVIIAAAISLALTITGVAVWNSVVRAPDPVVNKPNDTTIYDTESGDQPESIELGDRVADYFTFVVGAVDEDQTRTDALMVCGFDTKNKKINILNIPRDTMSDVSRRGPAKKINAAYGTKKGIEQTKAEIKKLIGFTPDYYIVLNFQGIADIVDAIGGVDYEIPFRMYYQDPSQDLSIDFQPGMRHLNGKEVVEFLRWRKNNGGVKTGDPNYTGGDEERITKQQEFLQYLASQVLRPSNVANVKKICDAVFQNVKTDLTAGNMLWMGMQAIGTSSDSIRMHTLPGYEAYSYAGTDWYGSFFFPDETDTLALVNEYFNPYVNKVVDLDIVSGPDKASYTPHTSSSSSNSNKTSNSYQEKEPVKKPSASEEDGDAEDPEQNSKPEGEVTPEDGQTTPSEGNGTDTPTTPTTPPPTEENTGNEETPPVTNNETPPADTSGSSNETVTPPAPEQQPPTEPSTPPPSPPAETPPPAVADPEA